MLILRSQIKKYSLAVLGALVSLLLVSCDKDKIEPVETYPESPRPLVKFLDGAPSPAIGSEGSVVTFNVSGLKGKEGQFKFFINQTEAEVVAVEENAVKVKVPANASTGGSAVLINSEYYFGPSFTVRGKISIDPLFNADAFQANNLISGIFKRTDGSYLIYGAFTDYRARATIDNPITGLAVIDDKGEFVSRMVTRKGLNGAVNSVIQLPNGKYMLSGEFTKYDTAGNINYVTRLNNDGTLDMTIVDVINPDPVNNPGGGQATVPSFNGGVTASLFNKIFYNTSTGYTTIAGNFSNHISTFYEQSTVNGPYYDIVRARQLIRMKENGAYDSSYNYDYATKQSFAGANGFILDAIEAPGSADQVILAGTFTNFDGKSAKRIVRINADGRIDETFNASGEGADGTVSLITYNSTTGKILLTGSFKNYNGEPASGVVMINPDGTRDQSFSLRDYAGGLPSYAGQLKNGKIILSGSFESYDGVIRAGFAVLNPDGSLAAGYNNTGLFRGVITGFVETPTVLGIPTLMLVGIFDRFDSKEVGNIVKIRMEN